MNLDQARDRIAELEKELDEARQARADDEGFYEDACRKREARITALEADCRLLGAALASYRVFHTSVPCPYCGPGTPNTVTDCEGCDGHGRAPHQRMQDEPEAVYAEVAQRDAAVDASPSAGGWVRASPAS